MSILQNILNKVTDQVSEEFFRSQYRLAMMARNLDRMDDQTISKHYKNAEKFLESLY